jgi:hypothetical protein
VLYERVVPEMHAIHFSGSGQGHMTDPIARYRDRGDVITWGYMTKILDFVNHELRYPTHCEQVLLTGTWLSK